MKLICWDYNETIVGRTDLRPNMAEVLTSLRADGYTNVVTTTIGDDYVKTGLKNLGIDSLVDGVFGNRRSVGGHSKSYIDVLKAMKVPEDKAPQSVVVIGDKEHDHPADLEKVVFIQNPNGHRTDAKIVQQLLDDMYRKGEYNFYRGFNRFKTTDIELKDEAGFAYHGQILLPKHKGILLSTYNGCPWATPTVLLIPTREAKQFNQFEVRS